MTQNVVKIDYIPTPTALRFHRSKSRVRCLSGGYGSGKSTAGFIEVLKLCSIKENKGMFLRKTYLELQMLVNEFENLIIDRYNLINYYKYYEKKQKIELFDSIIYLRSCDDPKKLKQLNLGWCLIDEAIEVEKSYYDEILNGRLRLHNNTKLILLTNPDTPDHWIYQEYMSGNIELFEMSTFENAEHLPADFIENAKKKEEQDRDYYEKNFLGKWVTAKGQVLWGVKQYEEQYIFNPKRGNQVIIGIDWGYSPDYTAVVFIDVFLSNKSNTEQAYSGELIDKYIIFDCIYTQCKITAEIRMMITEKLKKYGLFKSDVIVYADNAEPDRINEMVMDSFIFGKTIKRIENFEGVKMEVTNDAYEFINTHNVYYLPHLIEIKKNLHLFRYKKKDDGSLSDIVDRRYKHIPDAIRYAVYSYYKEQSNTIKTTMQLETYIALNRDDEEYLADEEQSHLLHMRISNRRL